MSEKALENEMRRRFEVDWRRRAERLGHIYIYVQTCTTGRTGGLQDNGLMTVSVGSMQV